jgi:hypothetical protein
MSLLQRYQGDILLLKHLFLLLHQVLVLVQILLGLRLILLIVSILITVQRGASLVDGLVRRRGHVLLLHASELQFVDGFLNVGGGTSMFQS